MRGGDLPPMHGRIVVRAFKDGRFIWQIEKNNLIVTAHNVPTAHLLGGDVTNFSIAAMGFGSGTSAPAAGDTALTTPAYFRAVSSHSYPVAGQVQFNWALTSGTDTSAYGINIQEVGLFCNTGAVSLPTTGTPSMTLFAHALLGLGLYASGLTYSGTWTITC